MKCQLCHQKPSVVGVIINGKYLKLCASCKPLPQVNSGHARWARTIDMEDMEHAVQQPYNKDGSINTRFAKLYPTQAKAIFTPEQLDRAMRK